MTYPRGSVEYVAATVIADVDLTDSTAVELSLSTGNATSGYTHTWLAGTWEGAEGTTRTARTADPLTFAGQTYPARSYTLCVRLTDTPEVPIIIAGLVRVTA